VNGVTLKLISESTGVGYEKLRQVVSRHPELQAMPYSVKNGGTRVFFPEFIEWLAKYEGVTEVTKASQVSQAPKKLPSGAQMKVMLDAVKAKVMSPVQFQEAIGVTIPGRAPVQSRLELGADGGRVSPEDLEKGLMSLVPGRGASA
jgi:hypothetical protein